MLGAATACNTHVASSITFPYRRRHPYFHIDPLHPQGLYVSKVELSSSRKDDIGALT
jgi:hypothetical protein